jgi:hypothetical protein
MRNSRKGEWVKRRNGEGVNNGAELGAQCTGQRTRGTEHRAQREESIHRALCSEPSTLIQSEIDIPQSEFHMVLIILR